MDTARVPVPETLCLSSLRALTDTLTQAIDDPAIQVVVLEGTETAFCRGLDFEQLMSDTDCRDRSTDGTASPEAAMTAFADCLNVVSLAGKPTLARIAGPAMGRGVGLAAACDVVLADENASFALPELLFGLTPATILPVLLGRLSTQQVRLSALQGTAYDARSAHAVGLVDEVVGAGELDAACRRWERTLGRVEPRAVAQLKRLIVEGVGRQGEAIRRGAALTASALSDETVLGTAPRLLPGRDAAMGGAMSATLETPRVRAGWEETGVWAVEMCDLPEKNALDERMADDLQEALQAAVDPAVKVVVLLGLPEVFCSGAPAELLQRLAAGQVAPTDITLARAVLDVPVPTAAAMEGHAVGGGLALGCCADIVLVARESRYAASFMNLGFTPGMGLTRLLEHVLSPAIAHELLYTGEHRKGADFLGAGGFNSILPRAEVRPRAFETAWRIADKPRPALEILKRVLSIRRRQAFEETRTLEALMHGLSLGRAEVRRRIEEEYVQ